MRGIPVKPPLQRSVHRVLADNVENRCTFEHFRRAAMALGSQLIAMPARYEFADLAHFAFSFAGRSGAAAMALAGALR